jgi:hypothetical protein
LPPCFDNARVRAIALWLAAFTLLIVAAARCYPGGTFYDPRAQGFDFWGNYWCDLLESASLSGAPNTLGQLLARCAFAAFALAQYAFWPLAADLLPSQARSVAVVRAGRVGALMLVPLSFVPPYEAPLLHGALVVAGALLSLFGVLRLALRPPDHWVRLAALSALLLAGVCLVQYVRQGLGHPAAHWLPGAQKCATLALLGLMLACVRRVRSA